MKKILFTIIFVMFASTVWAEDIYLAAIAAGTEDGSSCANAKLYTFFNNAANWGGGAGEIDPGDTVHICGTITGAAGATLLTVQGSGTAGNVITILFESGAILQAPYFPALGGINIENFDYIKVDGGTNGIIQATDNGSVASGKTYHENAVDYSSTGGSQGIFVSGVNNVEICNLTIRNIFVNTGGNDPGATDNTGQGTKGIYLSSHNGSNDNILIHNCTISNARAGIQVDFTGYTMTGIKIYNNSFSDQCWVIGAGAGSANSVLSNIEIYNNEMTDWNLWQYPISAYHTDGLIIFSNTGSGTSSYSGKFYNNYIHGNLGQGSASGFVGTGCGGQSFTIYNNLFVCDSTFAGSCVAVYNAGPTGCTAGQPVGTRFLNNTVIGSTAQKGSALGYAVEQDRNIADGGSYMIVKNNIFKTWTYALNDENTDLAAFTTGDGDLDYNLYYDLDNGFSGQYPAHSAGDEKWTLANLQAGANGLSRALETNGTYIDPVLDGSYKLQATSPASTRTGNADLSGIFTTDKDGATRTGWSKGAYEYGGSIPSTTTGLTITGGTIQ